MARFVRYSGFVQGIVKRYLRAHYTPAEAAEIWNRTLAIYKDFVAEAPDLGGSENSMSGNLYLALAVFAFYEATGRSVSGEELRELMTHALPARIPVVGGLVDMNKPLVQTLLRLKFERYKAISDYKLARGKWGNNWRVELNPHGRTKGVAFDLVGCPLVDFARKHGYDDIMPLLCEFDHVTAGLMHAKLIREHTIAEGGSYCDYWYLGDKESVE